jgi:selenocysteine lyase/cysteine desulfurase
MHLNVTGQISPVDLVVRIAKDKKILTLLDCSQTVGMLSIDAFRLDVDFIAGTCHKGLLSLPGLGFVYIKNPDLVDVYYREAEGLTQRICDILLYHP